MNMDMPITLRRIEETDAPDVQDQVSDRRIADTCGVPHPYPPNGASVWSRKMIEECARGIRYPFVILFDGLFAGYMELELSNMPEGAAEIGYWVSVDQWNRGIATEACRQFITFGFEDIGLSCLTAKCLERNPASARVLQKNGFQEVGKQIETDQKSKFLGERWRFFQLTRERWQWKRFKPLIERKI